MLYIVGIAIIFLIVFIVQKLLVSAEYQKYMRFVWAGLVIITVFVLTISPFRFERIWYDLTHLLG